MPASVTTSPDALCRDCLGAAPADAAACPACGGRRLLSHPELDALTIAHLDCDAFYAAVEKRDDPTLADLPLIIGGGRRGVVTTACYIARQSGVRSAMPMFKARQLCPEAVVIPPQMDKYVAESRRIRTLMLGLTPQVEPLSIDEAFLDLGGTQTLHGATPAMSLVRLQRQIEVEIGITVSVGLSFNKFLAKIASDQLKPRGFSVIGRAEAVSFLAKQKVGLIWGVGPVLERRLADDGLTTIGQLQHIGEAELARRYGSMGARLYRLSRAEDGRTVEPRREAKSVGAETTFEADLSDPAELAACLRTLAERVSQRMKAADLAGSTVTLKLKTADFRLRTRARRLDDPTRLADRIYRAAAALLAIEADGTRFRLIGVSVADFADPALADPPDLFDQPALRRAKAEAAVDAIRARFGTDSVGLGLRQPRRRPPGR